MLKTKDLVRAAFACVALVAFGACLPKAGITPKKAVTVSGSQVDCLLPNQNAVAAIGQRLAASDGSIGKDLCLQIDKYECYVRKFSPTVANGETSVEECGRVDELGGEVCVKMKSRSYNTREASRMPGSVATASHAGGEFNRAEYVCHHRDLRDGENFLAVGEGEQLKEALAASYAKCTGVAVRLAPGK